MPFIKYIERRFKPKQIELIEHANRIINDYKRQGYSLTLRGVYYQLVAQDLFPVEWQDPATGSTNNAKSYEKLGDLFSDARLAGLMDWQAIEDKTRSLSGNAHYESPKERILYASYGYAIDKWEDQPYRIEVWVEKDAMEGVIAKPCRELDIDYFSCRGYTSQTAMWDASQRFLRYADKGQNTVILHLGDHDPSGIDMTRDIEERLRQFMKDDEAFLTVERIALNMNQIHMYNPPENPAKITDPKAKKYIAEYGESSWELDALAPKAVYDLIKNGVEEYRNDDLWKDKVSREKEEKQQLRKTHDKWEAVTKFLTSLDKVVDEDDEDEDEYPDEYEGLEDDE